jgi:hypothetical protein
MVALAKLPAGFAEILTISGSAMPSAGEQSENSTRDLHLVKKNANLAHSGLHQIKRT